MASAQAVISTTGPDSYNSINENNGYGGSYSNYRVNDWYGQDLSWADGWDNYSPVRWQDQGRSFNDWYNGCMNYLSSHAPSSYQWYQNNDWSYGGGNYGGSDWNSWNPQNWKGNSDASYGGWYQQMLRYMDNNYYQWQNNWSDNYNNNNDSSDHHHNYQGGYGNDYVGNGGYTDQNFSNNEQTNVRNTNDVNVSNNNPQTATTGNVTASRNTEVGDVYSGNATNDSETNIDVNASNDSSGAGSGGYGSDWVAPMSYIDTTGPGSRNTIDFSNRQTTNVTNTNDVTVRNTNDQTARSGNVNVSRNTVAGDVYSGDASNYSSTAIDVSTTNN